MFSLSSPFETGAHQDESKRKPREAFDLNFGDTPIYCVVQLLVGPNFFFMRGTVNRLSAFILLATPLVERLVRSESTAC
jgi:hypothetical protein